MSKPTTEEKHKVVEICLRAGIDYVLSERKKHGKIWASRLLTKAVEAGKIRLVPIMLLQDAVKIIETPLCWTDNDVNKCSNDMQLVALSKNMIDNLLNSSENSLEKVVEISRSNIVLVSSNMNNVLSGIGEIPGQNARFCTLVTVYKETKE